jgi:hypothetical protein
VPRGLQLPALDSVSFNARLPVVPCLTDAFHLVEEGHPDDPAVRRRAAAQVQEATRGPQRRLAGGTAEEVALAVAERAPKRLFKQLEVILSDDEDEATENAPGPAHPRTVTTSRPILRVSLVTVREGLAAIKVQALGQVRSVFTQRLACASHRHGLAQRILIWGRCKRWCPPQSVPPTGRPLAPEPPLTHTCPRCQLSAAAGPRAVR